MAEDRAVLAEEKAVFEAAAGRPTALATGDRADNALAVDGAVRLVNPSVGADPTPDSTLVPAVVSEAVTETAELATVPAAVARLLRGAAVGRVGVSPTFGSGRFEPGSATAAARGADPVPFDVRVPAAARAPRPVDVDPEGAVETELVEDASVDEALDASGEPGSAAAIAALEKTAAPIPRATARLPTRPIQLDAVMLFSQPTISKLPGSSKHVIIQLRAAITCCSGGFTTSPNG